MDLQRRRELALTYLDIATNDEHGREEYDPIYIAVTEERDGGARYSSCGDLAHWLLFRLGIRDIWLNRAEHRGWKMGANVSRLAFECPAARYPRDDDQYRAGDVLIVWNQATGADGHVIVVREHHGAQLLTAEYGQPGGKRCARVLSGGKVGSRKLQRVLPLADIVHSVERGLAEPEPIDDWLTGVHNRTLPVLRVGSRGARVMQAQHMLRLQPDGDFGPVTKRTVEAVQRAHQLPVTGIIGSDTWAVLLDEHPL